MLKLDPVIWSLAVALGIGLLIGIDRERRKGSGPERLPAGLRTFALASLAGAISFVTGGMALLAATTVGIVILIALAYWRASGDDPGLTTELALVTTVLLGGLAVTQPDLATAIAVSVAILLNARAALHRFTRTVLTEDEIRDALTFAAATLIVLPLLPNQDMGPFGALNPRSIWLIVILVMAVGAFGHIAVRLVGNRYGLPVAGLASGFISGTATVAAMGERAAKNPDHCWPVAAGAVLSTVGTIALLSLLLAATNTEVLMAAAPSLALSGITAVLYGLAFSFIALSEEKGLVAEDGHAFSLWTALIFAAILAVVLLVSRAMNEWFGASGVAVTAAVAGVASVDPAVISVAALTNAGKMAPADAVFPILIALSVNTVTKIVLAASTGGLGFSLRVVPGLLLVVAAAWAGWWLPEPKFDLIKSFLG